MLARSTGSVVRQLFSLCCFVFKIKGKKSKKERKKRRASRSVASELSTDDHVSYFRSLSCRRRPAQCPLLFSTVNGDDNDASLLVFLSFHLVIVVDCLCVYSIELQMDFRWIESVQEVRKIQCLFSFTLLLQHRRERVKDGNRQQQHNYTTPRLLISCQRLSVAPCCVSMSSVCYLIWLVTVLPFSPPLLDMSCVLPSLPRRCRCASISTIFFYLVFYLYFFAWL